MKTLDVRSATDEYMSTHSLTFSTPDLILKEFVIRLCEQVSTRDEKEQIPRIMLYLKDKDDRHGKGEKESLYQNASYTNKDTIINQRNTVTEVYGGLSTTPPPSSSDLSGNVISSKPSPSNREPHNKNSRKTSNG
jgi:hypothetical protein